MVKVGTIQVLLLSIAKSNVTAKNTTAVTGSAKSGGKKNKRCRSHRTDAVKVKKAAGRAAGKSNKFGNSKNNGNNGNENHLKMGIGDVEYWI
jgi:hypothetical protein